MLAAYTGIIECIWSRCRQLFFILDHQINGTQFCIQKSTQNKIQLENLKLFYILFCMRTMFNNKNTILTHFRQFVEFPRTTIF